MLTILNNGKLIPSRRIIIILLISSHHANDPHRHQHSLSYPAYKLIINTPQSYRLRKIIFVLKTGRAKYHKSVDVKNKTALTF